MVPVGLMYLSAYLKEKLGEQVEIKIISTLVDLDSPGNLKEVLHQFSPHLVGIRSVIFYTGMVRHILDLSQQVVPEALRVVGGPNITVDLDFIPPGAADILVRGEGEITFYEIVRHLAQYGKNHLLRHLSTIKGIIYRDAGQFIPTGERELLTDLDQLPIPDYSLIDFGKYSGYLNFGYNRRPMAALFTSRGCPYHCIYCHRIFGKNFRGRSAANVYQEICFLKKEYRINDFCIVDDNFNVDKKRMEELAQRIIGSGLKINLYFPNGLRGDILSKRLFDQLVEAGMIYISFSLETASPRLQKQIKKNINIEKLKEIVEYSSERNIITNLAVMVGFPSETIEEARHSLEYLAQFKRVVLPYYFSVKYYPGTELFQEAEHYGIHIDKNILISPYHGYQFQETPHISPRDFEELNRWYLKNIFLDPERLRNTVNILSQHFTREEINDMFSLFFRKPITDIEADVINKHRRVSASHNHIRTKEEHDHEERKPYCAAR